MKKDWLPTRTFFNQTEKSIWYWRISIPSKHSIYLDVISCYSNLNFFSHKVNKYLKEGDTNTMISKRAHSFPGGRGFYRSFNTLGNVIPEYIKEDVLKDNAIFMTSSDIILLSHDKVIWWNIINTQ